VSSLGGAGHSYHALDVSDEDGWRAVPFGELQGLVCAAAMLGPIGTVGEFSSADFRRTLDVNVVGTMLAVNHCLPALRESGGAIVTFGGGGATGPLPRFDAYAASKAAIARLTENLALVLSPTRVNCVAPGFVATRMHAETLEAGPELVGAEYYDRTRREVDAGGYPASEAAELVSFLLSAARFSGRLISAQWDPWRDPAFQRQLEQRPELGTIRRIDGVLVDSTGERSE
jgi:3-oxoacyl-[acyl-carrier protein] reductase